MTLPLTPLKPAISTQAQVDLLIERGMVVENRGEACNFLLHNNYYRINIYFHQKMGADNLFTPGTSFEQIVDIYNNDQWLRNHLLAVLEPIEIKLRSNLAHFLGMKYGSDCFYNTRICEDIKAHIGLLALFYDDIICRQKDPIIKHHINNYGSRFPIWVVVENLSMNETSKYFSSLISGDKKAIALQAFNLDENILKSWLEALGVLRNICAHYGFLHCRKFTKKPETSKSMKILGVPNDTVFSYCLIIKELTDSQLWQEFVTSIQEKAINTPSLILSEYGFPDGGLAGLKS
jgi:abortive infection bacteriophage resistance protein